MRSKMIEFVGIASLVMLVLLTIGLSIILPLIVFAAVLDLKNRGDK
jgi:hypothetical protein